MAGPLCPPPEVLEEFAAGACTDEAVGAHVRACPACGAAVEDAREVNRFLSGVRASLAMQEGTPSPRHESPPQVEPVQIPGYLIEREIHRGGQGVVYCAVQTRTRRTVAIKVLLAGARATRRQQDRFEREVRIAASLRHPNIVTVYESGPISDRRYSLVMEYIDGLPLDQWSRTLDDDHGRDARRRSLRRRLALMAKVCDGVLYAHQHSIVHRDLKPANILVDAADEPHILDFGIARDIGVDERIRLTHTGEFAGTLAYASPEQVSGDPSRADTRTDIYSLGVIMYELVSGKMPYAVHGTMSEVLRGIEAAEPAPLTRRPRDPADPWVDAEVSTIILKALAKDPDRRYQTAAALRDDILRYLAGEAIEARRDSTWYVLRKAAARHRVIVAAAGIIIVLLAAFGVVMTRQASRLEVGQRELSASLNASILERARSLAAAGNTQLAEDLVFPELTRAGVKRINGPEVGFSGSPEALHAYWATWDVLRNSRRVATLRMPSDLNDPQTVIALYFDQGGRRLTALDTAGTLTSWSAGTWEVVRHVTLVARIDGVHLRYAPSPGGSIAVFGAGMIRVINPETGRVEAQADDPESRAVTGAFSPDGTLLATTGPGNQLSVRDARSLAVIFAETDVVGDLVEARNGSPTFSPDGRLIGLARSDARIDLLNATTGALERSLFPPASLAERYKLNKWGLHGPAFAPDGTTAGWLTWNPIVWPADGGAPRDLGDPGGAMWAVAFLPGSTGLRLVSTGSGPGGGAGFTNVWDLASGTRVVRFRHPNGSTALATSTEAHLIAIGTGRGIVHVYEADPEPHVKPLRHAPLWYGARMALSPDGRHLALTALEDAGELQHVELIDVATLATIARFPRTRPWTTDLAFAHDGQSWFESDRDGRIRQWDLHSHECVREFTFPDSPTPAPGGTKQAGRIKQLRPNPDGRILAAARDDGLIDLWDVPTGERIGVLKGVSTEVASIDFSPDGRTLVARHVDALVLWDVRTRRQNRSVTFDRNHGYALWSPTAPVFVHAASGVDSDSGRLQFVDADSGRVLAEGPPQTAGAAMAFHPDGTVLLAAARDSSIRLWDTRTGRELLSLQKHTQHIHQIVLTPDGNTLFSSDITGNVLVWDLAYYNDHIRRELERRNDLGETP